MRSKKITVIGAGYVGMSTALLFAKKNQVLIHDIDQKRVNLINITFDSENEIGQIRNHIPFSMCLVHAPTHVNIDVKDCVISGKDEPYLDSIVSDRESLQKHVNNWRFDTNGQNPAFAA